MDFWKEDFLSFFLSDRKVGYSTSEKRSNDGKRESVFSKVWQHVQDMALTDDLLFRIVLHQNPEVADFLSSFYIPGFKTGSIIKAVTNYEIPGASTKSSRLDVYAETPECVINIELQKRRDEHMSERIWQYGANIVNSFILRGSEYGNLPRIVHLVLTAYDMYGEGEAYYVLTMKDQNGVKRDSNVMIIYVNLSYRGNDRFGRLGHDFSCVDPEKMFYNMLSSSVRKIKHKEGGDEMSMSILEEIMGDEFEDFKAEVYEELKKEVLEKATAEGEAVGMEVGRAKGIAEGMAKGIEEGRARGIEEGRVRGIEEGRVRGIEEGRVRGIEEGRVRGIEEGRAEERLNFLRILLKENSAFDISSKYGIPLNEVNAVKRSLRL